MKIIEMLQTAANYSHIAHTNLWRSVISAQALLPCSENTQKDLPYRERIVMKELSQNTLSCCQILNFSFDEMKVDNDI